MPPKTKKELQEEAKRLEEEKKKKEQQQRLLEEERKKYASQTLSTGLVLPVTSLFLRQFIHKKLQFTEQILMNFLKVHHAEVISLQATQLQFILQQFYNNLRFAAQAFDLSNKSNTQQKNLIKARVFIGIMFALLKNNHAWFGGQSKNIDHDRQYFQKLILEHSIDEIPKVKILDKESVMKIYEFAQFGYFAHYNLITTWHKYSKRTQTKTSKIYVDIPAVVLNTNQTPFTDLSTKAI